ERRAGARASVAKPGRATLGGGQQRTLAHNFQGERLVADVVEEDDHGVVVVALDDALAPLTVCDTGAYRERDIVRRRADASGLAVVAAPARRLEGLAEVGQNERAPAV